MWQVVCVGGRTAGDGRLAVDRGPLHPDRAHADSIALFLLSTGLYRRVSVEGSNADVAAIKVGGRPSS